MSDGQGKGNQHKTSTLIFLIGAHLKVVTSVASDNSGLLSLHSINHVEEVNVGVTLSCDAITKCPLYSVVVLYVCV